MAQGESKLTVIFSDEAELDAILRYNVRRYGLAHADKYVAFLKSRLFELVTLHDQGHPVERRPDLRRIDMRRSLRGHGHVAVYRVVGTTVRVLHVFHAAQDISRRLADEP